MKARRQGALLGALVLAAGTATIAGGGTAFAAVPGNDLLVGATAVTTGFSASVDTGEATTDIDDAELNANCGAPATDASVWYTLNQPADGGVVVDVSGSDYSAGVIVASGGPGSWTVETCGPGTVGFVATAGTTYSILAFDDQLDSVGNGGALEISVTETPPPPTFDVSVNKFAAFNSRTGAATVSGVVTCTGKPQFAGMEVQLSQKVGRVATVRGWGFTDLTCDGTAQPWSVQIRPESGKFAGGKAASVTFAFACGVFQCAEDYQTHVVQLRGKG